jgi:competence protein ComEC
MRPSRISYSLTGSFLAAVFVLQWWRLPAYPREAWMFLGATMLTSLLGTLRMHFGWDPRATGGVGASGGALARGAFFFASFFCRADKSKKKSKAGYILAFSIGTALALWAVARSVHVITPLTIENYATNQRVTLTGIVVGEPRGKPPWASYPVAVESLTISGSLITPIAGRVLVEDPGGWPLYRIGDRISAGGKLNRPRVRDDFNEEQYLALSGITAVLRRATIEEMRPTQNAEHTTMQFALRRILQDLKYSLEYRINRLFPEPSASLIRGLLTGSRRGFSEDLLEDFNTTGLTHLIAISGTNVTIVIAVFGSLLFWVPLKVRFVPQVLAIILFVLLVGAEASVVRAGIMGILGLLALELGRINDTRLAILWTATLMTIWKPEQLWWDAGFQLSFAAVIGITEIGTKLKQRFTLVPETLGLRDSLAATLSAQLTTLPIIVVTFQRISLVAPFSNLLAAPMVPIAMALGFFGTCMSILSFPLGQIIAFGGYGAAEWIVGTATILARVPYASVTL